MDKTTGFVKRPTFAELAKLEQKVTYSKPIVRDAVAYWNSFDSAWLKGPLDEVSNRAFLAQQRRAIQQAPSMPGARLANRQPRSWGVWIGPSTSRIGWTQTR